MGGSIYYLGLGLLNINERTAELFRRGYKKGTKGLNAIAIFNTYTYIVCTNRDKPLLVYCRQFSDRLLSDGREYSDFSQAERCITDLLSIRPVYIHMYVYKHIYIYIYISYIYL